MSVLEKHGLLERSPSLLLVTSLLVVTVGGIVEIAPLFWLENTIEDVEGMRPYTPLELTGRDIYIREEGVARHYAFRNNRLRVHQVIDMPCVRLPLSDARHIRACPFRPTLERMIVLGFCGQ